MKNHKDERFYKPSGYNDRFDFLGNDFEDYIDETRRKIHLARLDLNTDQTEKIIDANSPFAWKQTLTPGEKSRAILLIHGLYDSPFSLKELGHSFYQQGFSVYGILLPGHGTLAGDLLNTHHSEWQKTLNFAMLYLEKIVDEIILCGFSTGGLLCIDYALAHSKSPKLKALITLAPPLRIRNCFAPLSPAMARLRPWFGQNLENNYVKYRSFSTCSIAQVYHLSQIVQKNRVQKNLNCPLFISVSTADQIVSAKECLKYFKTLAHPKNRCLVYTQDPLNDPDTRIKELNALFSKPLPNLLQHNGLPFSPENAHYGLQGDYTEDQELLYNPGFSDLEAEIKMFLENL